MHYSKKKYIKLSIKEKSKKYIILFVYKNCLSANDFQFHKYYSIYYYH